MRAAVSVVLAPDQGLGSSLRSHAERWAQLGLIGSTYWLSPNSVTGSWLAPRFSAAHIGQAGSTEVELIDALAQESVELVRLVCIVPVGADAVTPDPLLEVFERMVDVLKAAVPVVDRGSGAAVGVVAIKLVVPTSDSEDAQIQHASAGFAVTLVVAPEDRPTPESISTFVRAAENWERHAMAALASVSGMWSGVPAGVAEELANLGGSSQPDTIRVIRTFSRSTTSPDGTNGVLDEAVKWSTGLGRMPVGVTSGLVPSMRDDALVDDALKGLLERVGSHITPRPFVQEISPPKRTTGADAFVQLLRFAGWCLVMLVRVTAEAVIVGAERGATRLTYGTEGTTDVRFRPGRPESMERIAAAEIDSVILSNADLIRRAEATRQTVQTPAAWRAIRNASFGLVDGGAIDGGVQASATGNIEVVSQRSWVVPTTRPAVEIDGGLRETLRLPIARDHVSAHDPQAAAEVLQAIAELRAHLERRARVKPDQDDEHSAEGEADITPPSDDWDRVPVEETLRELGDLEAQVQQISAGSETSLVGRLLMNCSDGLTRAKRSLKSLKSSASTSGSFSADKVARARVRYLVGSYLLIAVAVYAGLASWRQWWPYNLTWAEGQASKVLAAAVLIALVGIALLIQSYFQAHSRFQRQLNLSVHQLKVAASECAHMVAEASRLEDVYVQLRDWAEIVSRSIHGPFATPEVQAVVPVVLPQPEELPLSVKVEQAPPRKPSQADMTHVAHVIVHPGWATENFSRLADYAFATLDASGAEGVSQADIDVPSAPNYAREHLRDELRSGRPQQANTGWLRDKIALELEESRASEESRADTPSLSVVERTFLSRIVGTPTLFGLAAFSDTGKMEGDAAPERSVVWAPEGLPLSDRLDHRPVARSVANGRVTTTVVRCDYSRPVAVDKLRFVAPQTHHAEEPLTSWRDSDY